MSKLLGLTLIVCSMYSWGPAFDGNPVGLTDMQGRELIPAKYSKIEYVGNGLFCLTEIDETDKYRSGLHRLLADRNGKWLPFAVPPKSTLEGVIWLGANAFRNKDLVLNELPADSLLVFRTNQRNNGEIGICDVKGHTVVPANLYLITCPNEGKMFLQELIHNGAPNNNRLLCLDLRTRRLTVFSFGCTMDRGTDCFGDGLAALRERSGKRKVGYVDESGKWLIKPKFEGAGPFVNGRATVNVTKSDVGDASWQAGYMVTIDKTGKIISPPNLDVHQFRGDYAVARKNGSSAFGVVDKAFRFVIPPKFERLSPQPGPRYFSTTNQPDLTDACKTSPLFYDAVTSGGRQMILAVDGKELFRTPDRYSFWGTDGDCILFSVETSGKSDLVAYLNMRGEKVSKPEPCHPEGVTFGHIAPDRLEKIVSIDDGKFDSVYWKNNHEHPISRSEMFERFQRQHTLLGMSRREVLDLLGPGYRPQDHDRYSYMLEGGKCTGGGEALELHILFDRVVSWSKISLPRF